MCVICSGAAGGCGCGCWCPQERQITAVQWRGAGAEAGAHLARVQLCTTQRTLLTSHVLPSPPLPCAGAFENTVQALYKYVVPKPKDQCTKGEQLGVSFAAGYIAGVLCAIVSHPADNLVSKMNAQKGVPVSAKEERVSWAGAPAGCVQGAGQGSGCAMVPGI